MTRPQTNEFLTAEVARLERENHKIHKTCRELGKCIKQLAEEKAELKTKINQLTGRKAA